ncbi:hypothetical protein KCU93_g1881, partial [Aureobasidium melanogenum]
MKFAKELEADLVPEWRAKYLDYKQGKKKLKAVARALQKVERTSPPDGRRDSSSLATFGKAPFYAFLNRPATRTSDRRASSGDVGAVRPATEDDQHGSSTAAMPIPGAQDAESTPLQIHSDGRHMTRYGSIIGSPPAITSPPKASRPSEDSNRSLKLPGPALGTPARRSAMRQESSGSAYQVGENTPKHPTFKLPSRYKSVFQPRRVNSMPGVQDAQPTRPPTRRMFSGFSGLRGTDSTPDDIALDAYREIDVRQSQFFMFLDKELEKIEEFYKKKEDEATERLKVLREQLHMMRDQRMEEILYATSRTKRPSNSTDLLSNGMLSRNSTAGGEESQLIKKNGPMKNGWAKAINGIPGRKRAPQTGKTFEAMKQLGTPSGPRAMDDSRDYIRRGGHPEVPYRTAKRKLKIALAEYYRGLELLKSYALLNRTAFRKINKKYDKTVNARPSGRYMTEKVNTAYFVNSTIVDGHIQAVEDMYARYFERGNHKIAVGKLRAKVARLGDYTGSVFRNGVLLATGAVFGIEGLVYGTQLLWHEDPSIVSHTSYLLQIYGGYFLMWFLSLLFCVACRIPSLLGFVFGLTIWLNFKRFTSDSFYIWWPVVLVCVSGLILFNPFPIFYHRSRLWFAYSTWRLCLAGVFPVEFRDFFLGDMFCSQTYALGNIELFFCLYANDWNNPAQCNSSHSRLLGFFATLPGIWRALQCLRRYADTRSLFPHMANFGKYMCTILYYMSLSLWRINKIERLRILFIFWATINGVYCSVWDIVMDWSLMDPYAKHPFLRNTLGFKYAWWYYVAMVLDPILRFNWIFYAIYGHDVQHSSIISFLVAFTEVLRRGMWQLFRVENEHCTNVSRYRASRDVPLPYELSKTEAEAEPTEDVEGRNSDDLEAQRPGSVTLTPSTATGVDPARRESNAELSSPNIRQRRKPGSHEASPMVRAIHRVGTLMRASHALDFERRRKSEVHNTLEGDDEDDDDSDEDNGPSIEADEIDGSFQRTQNKPDSDSDGNGKAPKRKGSDEDDEELVGPGSGSGGEGASSASDDQAIARARKLRKGG